MARAVLDRDHHALAGFGLDGVVCAADVNLGKQAVDVALSPAGIPVCGGWGRSATISAIISPSLSTGIV
jgi:hypothetical protein